jgi:glycosyltransferase involved in cell wall biosynthesis
VASPVEISVILATFRRPRILERTLDSLTRLHPQTPAWELVVVDNAGEVETQKVLEGYAEKLPLRFLTHTQPGKNAALNAGLSLARGELMVFTDDDTLADANWLREMWEGAARWPAYSIFGGRILPAFPEPHPPFDLRNRNIIQAFAIADWQEGEGIIPNVHVYGPNMALRRGLFADGRRFDETLYTAERKYMMADESSFLLSMQQLGHRSIYLPAALVRHQVRPEQLQLAWLTDRAFRSGRTIAEHERAMKQRMLLGVPRFVFSELIWHRIAAFWWKLRRRHSAWLSAHMEYWFWRGKYHQYALQSAPQRPTASSSTATK